MSPLRAVAWVVGLVAVMWLVSLVPDDVHAATVAFLLVAAAGILLLVAAAVVVVPARRLLGRVFALPMREEDGLFGVAHEDDLRAVFRPLVPAGVALFVAMASSMVR